MILGAFAVAYGVPISILTQLLFSRGHIFVIFLLATFWQLAGLSFTSVLWYIIPSVQETYWLTITLQICIQEIVRFFYMVAYQRTEPWFNVVSTNRVASPLIDFYSSIASGTGFGLTLTLLLYGSVLANTVTGPGTFFTPTCQSMSIYSVAAVSALFINIQQILWMIISFHAMRKVSLLTLSAVFVGNLCSGLMALIAESQACEYYVAGHALLTLVALVAVLYIILVRKNKYRSYRPGWNAEKTNTVKAD